MKSRKRSEPNYGTMRREMEALKNATEEQQRRIFKYATPEQLLKLDAHFEHWAHESQLPPRGEGWTTWLMMAGRGFGKTRAGSEWIFRLGEARPGSLIALAGATIGDARTIMVEGVSGLIAVAKRHRRRLKWEPSLGRLSWPNGSRAQLFSGDNPDGFRGPEHDFAWVLTFEVVGDEATPTVAAIIADATLGLAQADCNTPITGVAAYGSSMGSAVAPLVEAFELHLFDDGLHLRPAQQSAPMVITNAMLGNGVGDEIAARVVLEQAPTAALPASLRLAHYEPARDFQSAEARSSVSDQAGMEQRHELPAVIESDLAKSIAEDMLARRWAGREKLTLRLPPSFIALEPGSVVTLDSDPVKAWRVERCTIDRFVVIAELRPHRQPISSASAPAIASRSADFSAVQMTGTADATANGDLRLALFEVPPFDGQLQTQRVLLLAASSSEPTWRSRSAQLEVEGYALRTSTARRKSVLGELMVPMPTANPGLMDLGTSVDVQLIDREQWLTSCEDAALAWGENLAILGSELFQFGDALPLGNGRFRLSRLVRGVAGTEAPAHAEGDLFTLAHADSLRAIKVPLWSKGRHATVRAWNLNGQETLASLDISDAPLNPPIPIPEGGETVDSEARAALGAALEAMRRHGLIES